MVHLKQQAWLQKEQSGASTQDREDSCKERATGTGQGKGAGGTRKETGSRTRQTGRSNRCKNGIAEGRREGGQEEGKEEGAKEKQHDWGQETLVCSATSLTHYQSIATLLHADESGQKSQ